MADDAGSSAAVRTFLIADVRGYTRFTNEHGDEAGARLAARFAEVVGEVVEGRDGRVVELRGDEALCVFSSPRAALRVAVELQRRCADELRADPLLPLRLGIGIDAGEAVAVGSGFRGGALNLAARLCSLAGPGEVLVSEGFVHLARRVDDLAYMDRGHVELKGLDEPVHVLQVQFGLDMPEPAGVSGGRWAPTRLVAVTAAVVVVAAVVALAADHARGSEHPKSLGTNAVGVLDSSGRIVGHVPVGGRPGGVAAGAGSVWASDTEHDAVIQIDPKTQSRVDTIPTGADPTGVAVGGGGVWVADSGAGTVSWVNAKTPTTATPIRVGQGPGPIAYGMNAAWVVNTTDATLQRIGNDLKPSRPIAVGGSPSAVAVGGGYVWVTDTNSSAVIKVDPSTRDVVGRISVGANPTAVAFGARRVWVANAADGTVVSVNPATDQPRVISVGRDPTGIAYANGYVWVAVGQGALVARIDVQTLHVFDTPVRSVPQAVTVTAVDNRTWVTALAPPASHRGGTLRIAFSGDPFSPAGGGNNPFDPAAADYTYDWQLLSMTNDGLVTYRRAGDTGGTQVVPDLAVAMPTRSDGGRTYTFQLRRGIRYSNGDLVKASDFRYSVMRQFLPSVLARGDYYQNEMFSDLVGFGACVSVPQTCDLNRAIRTDNRTGTIVIHLRHPDPSLPEKLATTSGDLVPPGSPPPDSGLRVRGTGPYEIAKIYQDGKDGFLLIRNPYFHQWSQDAQPSGYPDRLRWIHVKSPSSELKAVERGTADMMFDSPPADRLHQLQTQHPTLIHDYATEATIYLAVNPHVPPFNHLSVRRALNLAVDRGKVAKLVGHAVSLVNTPTCQVLPPGLAGYRPDCPYTADPTPSGLWGAPDVMKAKQLVRASGTRGMPITLWELVGGGGGQVAVTEYLMRVLRHIGYEHVSIHVTSNYQTYNDALFDPRTRVQAGLYGWVPDYPNPAAFFVPLLTCPATSIPAKTNVNAFEFCDRHLDHLVNAAATAQATNPALAVTLWQQADQEAVNQAAWVPLTNQFGTDVIGPRVGNYQHNPQWGALLDQLWVK